MLRNFAVLIIMGLFAGNSVATEKASTKAEKPAAVKEDKKEVAADNITADQLLNILPDDVVIGDMKAPITIIEYASMSCTHCADFHNSVFSDLKQKYIDSGKVRFVFRDFPLNEPALRGAMMARCAAKDGAEKYLKFTKVIFSMQSNWAPKSNYLEVLANIGKLGGMKGEEFEACMANKSLEESVMKSRLNASQKLEIRSTPTFFINKEMSKGTHDLAYFSGVIDSLLAGNSKDSKESKAKDPK
ncbi:MAG: bdbD 2 [Rickettsiaceae bacterium]|jgi:protein-disulfide isomerase|nr:bdbD 2 [Rickettsiaceae bacterium]